MGESPPPRNYTNGTEGWTIKEHDKRRCNNERHFILVAWDIWKDLNDCVFNGTSLSMAALQAIINEPILIMVLH
jgi:hypothetical protein